MVPDEEAVPPCVVGAAAQRRDPARVDELVEVWNANPIPYMGSIILVKEKLYLRNRSMCCATEVAEICRAA
jgi:hypothetical protein